MRDEAARAVGAHKELRDLGEIQLRTEIDEVPGRLEVDAYREEVMVEHEAVGQVVRWSANATSRGKKTAC